MKAYGAAGSYGAQREIPQSQRNRKMCNKNKLRNEGKAKCDIRNFDIIDGEVFDVSERMYV